MNSKITKLVDSLWEQFIDSMTAAQDNDGAGELRDYTKNNGYPDSLSDLLKRETANEKQHRGLSPAGYSAPISSRTASKIILMNNATDGANKRRTGEPLPATLILVMRHTAVESMALGWMAGERLTDEWRAAVSALDYAKIMNHSEPAPALIQYFYSAFGVELSDTRLDSLNGLYPKDSR